MQGDAYFKLGHFFRKRILEIFVCKSSRSFFSTWFLLANIEARFW